MAKLEFAHVSKTFGDFYAVHDLNIEVAEGEFVVLVGPSGCGKTTALRMVAGLEEVSEGEIRIGDQVVNDRAPRDRDIAMVFQNYALYPHKSVYENLVFGLRMRKVPKDEQRRRVEEIARVLGLSDMLNRRPAQLSGGQRQRVAMGRAIVREPKAFLMDEPLSNLDAKLRVQMRAEIARIQADLGTTTIYVTHDQVEAMTMGDRVAVLKKGRLQQVDTPQALYDSPVNLFVGGFIGSPSMNMVEASVERDGDALSVAFADIRLRLPEELTSRRPSLAGYAGKTVIVGIRPEDIEDAEIARDAPSDRRFRTTVDLREALGSEMLVHFSVAEPPVLTEDTKELARDLGLHDGDGRARGGSTTFVARLDPRSRARVREPIELVVDAGRMHFFDPGSGLGIDTGGVRESASTNRGDG